MMLSNLRIMIMLLMNMWIIVVLSADNAEHEIDIDAKLIFVID